MKKAAIALLIAMGAVASVQAVETASGTAAGVTNAKTVAGGQIATTTAVAGFAVAAVTVAVVADDDNATVDTQSAD